MPGDFTEPVGDVTDTLKVALVREGKILYDSKKDPKNYKPQMVIPKKPKTFCLDCGGPLQAVIFQCKHCNSRFVQAQEMIPEYDEKDEKMKYKPGRILVFALPPEENIETTDTDKVLESAQSAKNNPQNTPSV